MCIYIWKCIRNSLPFHIPTHLSPYSYVCFVFCSIFTTTFLFSFFFFYASDRHLCHGAYCCTHNPAPMKTYQGKPLRFPWHVFVCMSMYTYVCACITNYWYPPCVRVVLVCFLFYLSMYLCFARSVICVLLHIHNHLCFEKKKYIYIYTCIYI